jgi:hypothetical protein
MVGRVLQRSSNPSRAATALPLAGQSDNGQPGGGPARNGRSTQGVQAYREYRGQSRATFDTPPRRSDVELEPQSAQDFSETARPDSSPFARHHIVRSLYIQQLVLDVFTLIYAKVRSTHEAKHLRLLRPAPHDEVVVLGRIITCRIRRSNEVLVRKLTRRARLHMFPCQWLQRLRYAGRRPEADSGQIPPYSAWCTLGPVLGGTVHSHNSADPWPVLRCLQEVAFAVIPQSNTAPTTHGLDWRRDARRRLVTCPSVSFACAGDRTLSSS